MGIYIKSNDISFPLPYGHRISILSDGHAYYEDMVNPYVDLGEVLTVPNHGDLIDREAIPYMKGEWAVDDRVDRYTIEEIPPIISADKEDNA